MNPFLKAQFNYCPIIWMFHSRCLNNKINRFDERCFGMIYNDKISNFEELLNTVNSVSIRHNNIHVANDMLPDMIKGVFKLRITPHYDLRDTLHLSTDPVHSAYNGTESASYLGPKIWEQIPAEIKNKDFLDGFKKEINKCKPTECPCRICKTFVSNLGSV